MAGSVRSYSELLHISGSFASLAWAASIVRQHALQTLDPRSINLVRALRNAESPDEAQVAFASLRKWVAEVGGEASSAGDGGGAIGETGPWSDAQLPAASR